MEQLDETGQLVRRAAAGDAESWNRLVNRFAGLVWAVARSFGLNSADATDVTQTTWLRLVENMERLRQPERVGAWLATTARRESLRLIRLSKRSVPLGEERAFDELLEPEILLDELPFITADRGETVAALLGRLPHRQNLILRLLSANELSYQEISEAFGIPIGSIGPTRARALEHLKRLCLEAGISEY